MFNPNNKSVKVSFHKSNTLQFEFLINSRVQSQDALWRRDKVDTIIECQGEQRSLQR